MRFGEKEVLTHLIKLADIVVNLLEKEVEEAERLIFQVPARIQQMSRNYIHEVIIDLIDQGHAWFNAHNSRTREKSDCISDLHKTRCRQQLQLFKKTRLISLNLKHA